jgi:hypothetical protein
LGKANVKQKQGCDCFLALSTWKIAASACNVSALQYIRRLMMRKLLILLLALTLGTAATASEWLQPVEVESVQTAANAEQESQPSGSQHYFETLQIIPSPVNGLQLTAFWSDAVSDWGMSSLLALPRSAGVFLPAAIIRLNRVLYTRIMPAQAP